MLILWRFDFRAVTKILEFTELVKDDPPPTEMKLKTESSFLVRYALQSLSFFNKLSYMKLTYIYM